MGTDRRLPKPLGILVFALLMVLGAEVLRRQTAREFPDTDTKTPAKPASGSAT
jgi:hypothetical protein